MFHLYNENNNYILSETVYYNIQVRCSNLLIYGYFNVRPLKLMTFIEWFALKMICKCCSSHLFRETWPSVYRGIENCSSTLSSTLLHIHSPLIEIN
jgi:hypothetical protein